MLLKNLTRQLFAQLSRHLPRRLIQRDLMPDDNTVAHAQEVPASLSEACLKYAAAPEEQLYRDFKSHPEGLNV